MKSILMLAAGIGIALPVPHVNGDSSEMRGGMYTIPAAVIEMEKKEKTVQEQIAEHAGKHTKLALAVSFCESSWRPDVRGKVDKRDRGLYQINKRWNPDVSDECAFSVECSTKWFVKEVEKGRLWKWKASKSCWSKKAK